MHDPLVPAPANAPPLHPFDILLQIDQRVKARSTAAAPTAQLAEIRGRLAFRLEKNNLLFSMDDVAEITPVPRITRVPGVKNWLLGITNLRGKVIAVTDLRCFLTGRQTTQLQNSQLVVLRDSEWDYGLLVDEIIGMRSFGTQHRLAISDLAGIVDLSLRPYVEGAFLYESQHWLLFSARTLVKDQRFLNAAANS